MTCACCCSCLCGATLPSDGVDSPELHITFSYGFDPTVCLKDMDSDTGLSDAPQLLQCGPGDDEDHPAQVAGCFYWIVYYDGTCHWRIYFSVTDCDCETGDGCTWTVEGWENYDFPTACPYSISSIEITGTC